MRNERELMLMITKAERAKKIGFALTPIGVGITTVDAVVGSPFAFVAGVCTLVMAGATVVNMRTERRLRRALEVNQTPPPGIIKSHWDH